MSISLLLGSFYCAYTILNRSLLNNTYQHDYDKFLGGSLREDIVFWLDSQKKTTTKETTLSRIKKSNTIFEKKSVVKELNKQVKNFLCSYIKDVSFHEFASNIIRNVQNNNYLIRKVVIKYAIEYFYNEAIRLNILYNKYYATAVSFQDLINAILKKDIRSNIFNFLIFYLEELLLDNESIKSKYIESVNSSFCNNAVEINHSSFIRHSTHFFIKNQEFFVFNQTTYYSKFSSSIQLEVNKNKNLYIFVFLVEKLLLSKGYKKIIFLTPEIRLLRTLLDNTKIDAAIVKKMHLLLSFAIPKCDIIMFLLFGSKNVFQTEKYLPVYQIKILHKLKLFIRCYNLLFFKSLNNVFIDLRLNEYLKIMTFISYLNVHSAPISTYFNFTEKMIENDYLNFSSYKDEFGTRT
ncbi:hypothetical protein TUBRATIS_22040 [Tubulinosema ratisbonensis]|uniref:Uncharacterized protein n=1 Tax=Tubulinosema ratisbonensis TaxID=291195 RepID=A0A437AJR3_9MICR|nr:hypothetical protein TUBRATIS_22040 [Tubulinosema ratisbonensis]